MDAQVLNQIMLPLPSGAQTSLMEPDDDSARG